MKVLSVKQPWAGLLFHGKDVENRHWDTRYRGELLIHASKAFDKESMAYFHTRKGLDFAGLMALPEDCYVYGSILGVVSLITCWGWGSVRGPVSRWHAEGQVGWYVESQRLFDRPLACRGHLGLWDVPAELERYVATQMAYS